ncbi:MULTISPECIES: hypothetical protein [unclassified Nocardioides]|uniref:hypothetical protein n=1 Tax=unclassified Nocardioides TaxID=2615069 RepID=UPI0000571828|nr:MULTISPECIES: hypothetical protein [unclassified Nocardioides]ABL83080.1 conserved hypothetical protein [Nocardioides sp. JS614]
MTDPSRAPSDVAALADQLLDAQVAYHVARLSGAGLSETVAGLADDLLAASAGQPIADLVDRDTLVAIATRLLQSVPGSAATGAVVEVLADVVHDGPVDRHLLGELADREQIEALLD